MTLCCFSMHFFVDVVFHFSRLREGESVNIARKKCWGERGEKFSGRLERMPLCKLPVHGSYLYFSSVQH